MAENRQFTKRDLFTEILNLQDEQRAFWENVKLAALLAVEEVQTARLRFLENVRDRETEGSHLLLDVVLMVAIEVIPWGKVVKPFLRFGIKRSYLLAKFLQNPTKTRIQNIWTKKIVPELFDPKSGIIVKSGGKGSAMVDFTEQEKFWEEFTKVTDAAIEKMSPFAAGVAKGLAKSARRETVTKTWARNLEAYKNSGSNRLRREDCPDVALLDSFTSRANSMLIVIDRSISELLEDLRDAAITDDSDVLKVIDQKIQLLKKEFSGVAEAFRADRKKLQRFIEACIWALTYDFRYFHVIANATPEDSMQTKTSDTAEPLQRDIIKAEPNPELREDVWKYLSQRLLAPAASRSYPTLGLPGSKPSQFVLTPLTFSEMYKGKPPYKKGISLHLDALRKKLIENDLIETVGLS